MWNSTIKGGGEKNSLKEWFGLIVPSGLMTLLGCYIVMVSWHYRFWILFKSFLTPGGGRLLWLQNYAETFIYPTTQLTMGRFLQAGWGIAWQNRLDALDSNIQTAIFAQGGIFLVPFILIGLWQLRNDLRTKIVIIGWLISFFLMLVVFSFS